MNDLVEIISNYPFQELDMNEFITSPSKYLPQFLQSTISTSNEDQILSLVNELQSYQMVDNDDTSQIIINPLKQMYTNVKEPLFFTYSMSNDIPNEYSQPYNTELIFNNNFDIPKKCLLVVGAEGKGMRKLTKKECDSIISIPMNPNLMFQIDSLNTSNACSIALYEHFKKHN